MLEEGDLTEKNEEDQIECQTIQFEVSDDVNLNGKCIQNCSTINKAINESPSVPTDSRSSVPTDSSYIKEPQAKRKRSKTNIPVHIEKTISTLQSLKDEVLRNDNEDEFSYFAKNIACQLRKLPLLDALECQSDILNIIQKKRIASLKKSSTSKSETSTTNLELYNNMPLLLEIPISTSSINLPTENIDIEDISQSITILDEAVENSGCFEN